MKKIFFSCAVAMAALAMYANNFAGTAATKSHAAIANYALNDTTSKKDIAPKPPPPAPAFAVINVIDTVAKKDTTKKPPSLLAFSSVNITDTVAKKDTTKKPPSLLAFSSVNITDTVAKKDTTKKPPFAFELATRK